MGGICIRKSRACAGLARVMISFSHATWRSSVGKIRGVARKEESEWRKRGEERGKGRERNYSSATASVRGLACAILNDFVVARNIKGVVREGSTFTEEIYEGRRGEKKRRAQKGRERMNTSATASVCGLARAMVSLSHATWGDSAEGVRMRRGNI